MKRIIDFVEHQESPLINGIVFPDETIQLLNIKIDWETPINFAVSAGRKTSIKDLTDRGNLNWSDCISLVNVIDTKLSIEITAGEAASYGSDGFIGVIDLLSRNLIWLAFFDCSNPFNKIMIVDMELHAISTINCTWKFNLYNPIDCTVVCT